MESIKRSRGKLFAWWMILSTATAAGLVAGGVLAAEDGSFMLTASAVIPAVFRLSETAPKRADAPSGAAGEPLGDARDAGHID